MNLGKKIREYWKAGKNDLGRDMKYILPITVVIGYYLISSRFYGPAILTDEFGYLAKAASLLGNDIDLATKYHGGYSLFLLPAFWLFSNPFMIYQAVLAINALMWGASAVILRNILKRFYPKLGNWQLSGAVALGMLYPAFIGGSGFALATSALTLVFMLSVLTLQKSQLSNSNWLIIFSLLSGFMYWLHPTGIVVSLAAISIFLIKCIVEKTRLYLRYTLVVVGMILAYIYLIHPWMNGQLIPEGYEYLNYDDNQYGIIGKITDYISSLEFWYIWPVILLGHLSYVIISTFGLAIWGIRGGLLQTRQKTTSSIKQMATNPNFSAVIFVVLTIILILLLGSVFMSSTPNPGEVKSARSWIYGRYSSVFLLPLISMGLLSIWKLKHTVVMVGITILSGILIHVAAVNYDTLEYIDISHLQSFWPHLFTGGLEFIVWGIIGGAGVFIVWLLSRHRKSWAIALIAVIYLGTNGNITNLHYQGLSSFARPSGLVDFIRSNYETGSCIGKFGLPTPDRRLAVYSYYLYDYKFERITADNWQDSCNGPIITNDLATVSNLKGAQIIARETKYNLFVIEKINQLEKLNYIDSKYGNFYFNKNNKECVLAGCLTWTANHQYTASNAGVLVNGSVESQGKRGNLIQNLFNTIKKGDYWLILEGEFTVTDEDTRVEIINRDTAETIFSANIEQNKNLQKFYLTISEDANIDIVIKISKSTVLSLDSLSIDLR